MSSIVTGIDVPVGAMPAGMAFEDGGGSGGFGSNFLGALGKGVLGGLEKGLMGSIGGGGGSGSGGSSRGSYSDQTRSMLNYLIAEAIKSFEPGQSTLS